MAKTLATQFIETLFKSSRLVHERMGYNSDIAHLSLLQIQALSFLKRNANAQMREIAAHFRIELPSATSLLNKLVSLQLVKRLPDLNDRRLVRVALTEEGEALLQKALNEKTAHFEQMLSYLTETEKKELLRLLEKLNERMEKNYEK